MNILLDTNILLDVFLKREPWYRDAQTIWDAHHESNLVAHIPAHALTDHFYIARRSIGNYTARESVRLCLETFEIVSVGRPELERANSAVGPDFEDNLVLACASIAELDAIVTRDPRGFPRSLVPVLTPRDLLVKLGKEEGRQDS